MKTVQYLLALLAMMAANSASAELYLEAGFEGGGDELAFTTIGDSISAGGGIKLAIGVQNPIVEGASSFRLAVGYMFDSVDAINGSADINTLTLDGLYIVNTGPHAFGVGATMHMGPEYSDNLNGFSKVIDFDDAVGLMLQYGFRFSRGLEVGVRYTDITYEVNGFELDAGSVGLFISNAF